MNNDEYLNLGENENPDFVHENIIEGEDVISDNIQLPSQEIEIETEADNKTAKNKLAKKFTELLGQGYKPGEAAKLCRTTVGSLFSSDAFKKQVKQLIEDYNLPGEVRKLLVRSGLNQIAVANLTNPDPANQKLALDALKAIGSDPEVGLNAPPSVGVTINMGELATVLSGLDSTDKELIEAEILEEK